MQRADVGDHIERAVRLRRGGGGAEIEALELELPALVVAGPDIAHEVAEPERPRIPARLVAAPAPSAE